MKSRLPQKYIEILKEKNVEYKKYSSFEDLTYHTRIQSESFEDDFGKKKIIVNQKILDMFSENRILLCPLPHIKEISTELHL